MPEVTQYAPTGNRRAAMSASGASHWAKMLETMTSGTIVSGNACSISLCNTVTMSATALYAVFSCATRIDVECPHVRSTEPRRSDRKNARSRADIDDCAPRTADALQRFQTLACRDVVSCAKRHPRIDPNDVSGRLFQRQPRRLYAHRRTHAQRLYVHFPRLCPIFFVDAG
jgi:hypothetical protein